MIAESGLVQLPVSKDLWRGHVREREAPDNVDKSEAPRPFAKLDQAMAAILKASAGAKDLSCLWCGYQTDDKQMREHLKKNHASVVEPPTDAEIMLASTINNSK